MKQIVYNIRYCTVRGLQPGLPAGAVKMEVDDEDSCSRDR